MVAGLKATPNPCAAVVPPRSAEGVTAAHVEAAHGGVLLNPAHGGTVAERAVASEADLLPDRADRGRYVLLDSSLFAAETLLATVGITLPVAFVVAILVRRAARMRPDRAAFHVGLLSWRRLIAGAVTLVGMTGAFGDVGALENDPVRPLTRRRRAVRCGHVSQHPPAPPGDEARRRHHGRGPGRRPPVRPQGQRVPDPVRPQRARVPAAVEEIAAITERLLQAIGTPVAEGPDPFADPVTRRAIIAARAAQAPRSARRDRDARPRGT